MDCTRLPRTDEQAEAIEREASDWLKWKLVNALSTGDREYINDTAGYVMSLPRTDA